ncbi:MAG TPA: sigma-70 family RNA polymerase sigma factor [Clostridia bacterium]|nr:sigma-70 family RNA polymerase sigma factor [Clostridia bacterium]
MEMSDYEIIKSCLDGNHEAFSELITRYKKLIFSVIYNMIRDKQDLNDIAQEVFIKIYKSLDKYNPEYKFSTWSVKIATNYCLDTLRKKNVDQVPIEEISEVSSHDTPEEKYIKKERSEKIRKAIEDLPEKYRIPIILFHKNGLSYEEITEILKEPMTIIKNRLYRARLMLRDKLAEDRKEEVL